MKIRKRRKGHKIFKWGLKARYERGRFRFLTPKNVLYPNQNRLIFWVALKINFIVSVLIDYLAELVNRFIYGIA